MYNIPGYNMIHQGKICCGHGGLIIYLNDKYTPTVRKDLYKDSTVWKGLFIDISGETVSKHYSWQHLQTLKEQQQQSKYYNIYQ